MEYLLSTWITEVLPETIPGDFGARLLPGICPADEGDITGEAKLEAIEKLLDKGYLRAKITRHGGGVFKFSLEVWTGVSYRTVGRGTCP